MARMICLEVQDGEVFVNLDQVCQAVVTADAVQVAFTDGKSHSFTGPAAHALIQALRHEEKRVLQRSI